MTPSLKDLCIKLITNRYSMFKPKQDLLPTDLQKEIEEELPENKMQIIDGKYYPRTITPITGDWGTYKL